jgi:hypothetical protein
MNQHLGGFVSTVNSGRKPDIINLTVAIEAEYDA